MTVWQRIQEHIAKNGPSNMPSIAHNIGASYDTVKKEINRQGHRGKCRKDPVTGRVSLTGKGQLKPTDRGNRPDRGKPRKPRPTKGSMKQKGANKRQGRVDFPVDSVVGIPRFKVLVMLIEKGYPQTWMGDVLGVSPSMVGKHVRALRGAGFITRTVKTKGYQLTVEGEGKYERWKDTMPLDVIKWIGALPNNEKPRISKAYPETNQPDSLPTLPDQNGDMVDLDGRKRTQRGRCVRHHKRIRKCETSSSSPVPVPHVLQGRDDWKRYNDSLEQLTIRRPVLAQGREEHIGVRLFRFIAMPGYLHPRVIIFYPPIFFYEKVKDSEVDVIVDTDIKATWEWVQQYYKLKLTYPEMMGPSESAYEGDPDAPSLRRKAEMKFGDGKVLKFDHSFGAEWEWLTPDEKEHVMRSMAQAFPVDSIIEEQHRGENIEHLIRNVINLQAQVTDAVTMLTGEEVKRQVRVEVESEVRRVLEAMKNEPSDEGETQSDDMNVR